MFEPRPSATVTPGMATETPDLRSMLVLRGPDGFYHGEWTLGSGTPALAGFDALLNELVGVPVPDEIETNGTPEPTEGEQPASTPTPTPTS